MVAPKQHIEDYIPHRFPFVMVDNLLNVSRESFESDFSIDENNILVKNNFFQEAGLIENIAQTCAASFGYLDKAENENPKIGFIGAISRLTVHELPAVHSKINTIVTPTHQLGNIIMVLGRNFMDGRILMECEMKIVISES